jgi:hypothetical protein
LAIPRLKGEESNRPRAVKLERPPGRTSLTEGAGAVAKMEKARSGQPGGVQSFHFAPTLQVGDNIKSSNIVDRLHSNALALVS